MDTKTDPETFTRYLREAIENCSGGFCDCFCKYTGEPVNPVTILLERLKVPTFWVRNWANVKATHTPMKDKLLEFLTPQQHLILVKIEEIYMNAKEIDEADREKMRKILKKFSGQSEGA